MLKIKVEKLISILNLFSLDKNIIQFNIYFEEDKIKISGITKDRSCYSNIVINKTFFDIYENLGIFSIYDINKFINMLSKFKGSIEITKNNNCYRIKENKKSIIDILPDETFIEITDDSLYNIYEYKDYIEIDSMFFKEYFNDLKDEKKLFIKIIAENNKCIIKNKGSYIYIKETDINYNKEKKEIIVNSMIKNIDELYGKIELYIENDKPLQIIKRDKDYILKIIISQIDGEIENV